MDKPPTRSCLQGGRHLNTRLPWPRSPRCSLQSRADCCKDSVAPGSPTQVLDSSRLSRLCSQTAAGPFLSWPRGPPGPPFTTPGPLLRPPQLCLGQISILQLPRPKSTLALVTCTLLSPFLNAPPWLSSRPFKSFRYHPAVASASSSSYGVVSPPGLRPIYTPTIKLPAYSFNCELLAQFLFSW